MSPTEDKLRIAKEMGINTLNTQSFPHIITTRSSAGTGKTYALALQYLTLIARKGSLPDETAPAISRIVAITFTNKAAKEMRTRIMDWMKRVTLGIPLEGSGSDPIEEIIRGDPLSRNAPEDAHDFEYLKAEMKDRIKRNLDALLYNYHDFKVSTIDSFINLTLMASAFKLNLPPDFEISTDSTRYIELVLNECMQRIIEDDLIREKFDTFLENSIEIEGQSPTWSPGRLILDRILSMWQQETKENKRFFYQLDINHIRATKERLLRAITALRESIKATPHLKPNKKFLNPLEEFDRSHIEDLKFSAIFKRKSLTENGILTKASAPFTKEQEELWLEIKEAITAYVEAFSASRLAPHIAIYELIRAMLEKEVRHRRKTVLMEELNGMLNNIIRDEHFIPEIYYSLAERYYHFLIDEFQDTSYLQWKNIEVLVEEALSKGGSLFLVGDKKQAIYRWRGGRPELVDHIKELYRNYPVLDFELDTNYRSGRYIVEFNNKVFDPLNLRGLISSATGSHDEAILDRILGTYEGSTQKYLPSKADEGYIYIERLYLNGHEYDPEAEEEMPDEVIKRRLATLVKEILARGVFEEGDIAILVRTNDEARVVVKALIEEAIPVESEGTIDIRNHQIVREVVSFLKFLDNPEDDLSFMGFLTGEIFEKKTGIKREEVFGWSFKKGFMEPKQSLYKAFIDEYPSIWKEGFEHLFTRAGYLPLYDLVCLFLKRWGVFGQFSDETPYLLSLCELINRGTSIFGNNIHNFIRFWEERGGPSYSQDRGGDVPFLLRLVEGTHAIKVMTIHKAKGLKFPVVILPFLSLKPYSSNRNREMNRYVTQDGDGLALLYINEKLREHSERLTALYNEKKIEYLIDEINNIYVALTRPEKEMYILLPIKGPQQTKREANLFADYLFGLPDVMISGNTIEMGKRYEPKERDKDKEKGNLDVYKEIAGLGDFEGEIGWTEHIKRWSMAPDKIAGAHYDAGLFAKERGEVIHLILSLIKALPDDYERLLKERIRQGIAKYGFHGYEVPITDTIFKMFEDSAIRALFQHNPGSKVYTEREIVDERGESHKIDRLIVGESNIVLIEFKTGEEYALEHERQVSEYRRLVERIYPETPITSYIVYIDEGVIRLI